MAVNSVEVRRPALVVIGVACALAALWYRTHPALWLLPNMTSVEAIQGTLNQLSKDDPSTPDQDGHELERGEPLSDHALFSDWLQEQQLPARPPATVGGAIAYERPRTRRRLIEEGAAARQQAAKAAAQEAVIQREQRDEAARHASEQQALIAHYQQEQAAQAVADAARSRTVACNTARAKAYSAAKSPDAFIVGQGAPLPRGDGYRRWLLERGPLSRSPCPALAFVGANDLQRGAYREAYRDHHRLRAAVGDQRSPRTRSGASQLARPFRRAKAHLL